MTTQLDSDGLVEVDGRRLHVRRRRGEGPPVVLCSALGAVCTDWDLVLAELPGSDVVVYDRPGIGHSPPPAPAWPDAPPPTLHEEVRRLAALGPALGLTGPVVVVGHSSGGLIAQAFARRHPEQLAGLVLLESSTAAPAPSPGAAAVRSRIRRGLARTPLPRRLGPAGRRLLVWGQTVRGADPLDAAERRLTYGTREGIRAVLAELDGFDGAAADLAELEATTAPPAVPVAVLAAGSSGRPWPRRPSAWLREQERLAREWGAHLRVVEDSAHLLTLDRADAVADEIRRIVRTGQDGSAREQSRPPSRSS